MDEIQESSIYTQTDFSLQGAHCSQMTHRNPDDTLNGPNTESNFMEMEASVWLHPLRGIHHLEWLNFSNLSQLTHNKCKHSRAKLLIHSYSGTQALLTHID